MDTANRGAQAGVHAPPIPTRHIFISYARVDSRTANEVERSLADWGFRTWIDRQRLGGGQNWTSELERAVTSSAALVLILTPAALASPMVRHEYEQALACGIPVTLALRRRVGALPQALAHAPVIEMRNRLKFAADLYFALDDRGLAPIPPGGALDLRSSAAMAPVTLAVVGGRVPADWRVFYAPTWSYWLRLLGRATPMLVVLWALDYLPPAWWEWLTHQQAQFWVTNSIAPLFIITSMLFGIPAVGYALVLARIMPREMVVLTPQSCVISLVRVNRITVTSVAHRFMYAWAMSAQSGRDRWNGASVTLTGTGASGEQATFRLPWYWRERDAIARSIMADVAACPRQAPVAAAAVVASPVDTAAPQQINAQALGSLGYCLIAPREAQTLVASVQMWLGWRGLWPVEMVWTPGRHGVLAPTERGAFVCRVALFVDVPAIAQDPRWGAVLSDLRRRGVTLIPLRTQAKPVPSEWSSLQWVDFSPRVERDRSFLSLCDTLDRYGVLPTPARAAHQPFLDTELTLARATYQRLPPGWRDYAGSVALRAVETRTRQLRVVMMLLIATLLGFVMVTLASYILTFDGTSPVSATLSPLLAVLAPLGVLLVGALLTGAIVVQIALRKRAQAEHTHDRTIQERFIIAPDGLVFHLRKRQGNLLARRFLLGRFATAMTEGGMEHGCALFAQVQAMEARTDWNGARLLRLSMRDGGAITLQLMSLPTADLAIDQAREAFYAYWARMGAANGSARVAGQ